MWEAIIFSIVKILVLEITSVQATEHLKEKGLKAQRV